MRRLNSAVPRLPHKGGAAPTAGAGVDHGSVDGCRSGAASVAVGCMIRESLVSHSNLAGDMRPLLLCGALATLVVDGFAFPMGLRVTDGLNRRGSIPDVR